MQKKLFGGRQMQSQSLAGLVVEQVSNQIASSGGRLVDQRLVRGALAIEALNPMQSSDLDVAVESLSRVISSNRDLQVTQAQRDAALAAGILGSEPVEFLRASVPSASRLAGLATESVSVIGTAGVEGAMDNRVVSVEAYDNRENRNVAAYSVAYNLMAARQDEFGEAFYPTVVVTPENVGYEVSIRLHYVTDEVRRAINGSLSKFNRQNIINAAVDPTILRNDQTKIVPVVRSGGGANDSTANFVAAADVTPYAVLLDNASVTTAPLKIGKSIELLGVSQTDAMIASGVLDQTDAIDSSVRLAAVYVKLNFGSGVGATSAVVKFNTLGLPGSDFTAAPQGNTRALSLNFISEAPRVVAATKQVDGSDITEIASLATDVARLRLSIFGSVTQDTGVTTLNAAAVEVASVTNSGGDRLDLTTGAGAAAAALFAGATVLGYDLVAFRTNSNRRQRGQLIDTQYQRNVYGVPLLPPITALRPVGETEANDNAQLESLITATKLRTSNAAVTSLLAAAARLKEFVNAADHLTAQPEILGVARYMVKATYFEDAINVATDINSLTSSDRADDLQALLINKLRDVAFNLYVSSAYKPAADAINGGASVKPVILVGCDPYIARYLTLSGDTRTLTEQFDLKIVSTWDQRVRGTMFITIADPAALNSGVPSPLHFGAMAWKPELTVMMPITRNGATSFELTVQPSFRHIENLPVLGVVSVSGIKEAIASKISVDMESV